MERLLHGVHVCGLGLGRGGGVKKSVCSPLSSRATKQKPRLRSHRCPGKNKSAREARRRVNFRGMKRRLCGEMSCLGWREKKDV